MTRWSRFNQAVALGVCLLFVAMLRDARTPPVRWQRVELSEAHEALQNRRAAIRVVAEDTEGRPLAGATLRVLFMHDQRAFLAGAATTDAQGLAALERLPTGESWILAEAPGFARASTQVLLADGARDVHFALSPAQTLHVTVLDDDGAAIVRALVDVRTSDPLPYQARADEAGMVTLARLGAAPWAVRASADGFEATTTVVAARPATSVVVTLKRLGSLLVDTVDEEGNAIGGASVAIAGSGLWPARKTVSDARGRATLAAVPKGIYDLRATRGDLVSATNMGVALGRGETKSLTLMLARGRRAVVRVVDGEEDDARPVGGASVVVAEGGLSSFPLEALTDASGSASLGPLAIGEAFVSASANGFVPKTGVLLPPAAAGALRIALSRGATVLGEVADARGFPVGGATIEVVGTSDSGEPIDETSDRQAFRAAHFAWALTGPRELRPGGELGVMPGPVPGIPHASAAPGLPRVGASEPWVSRANGSFRLFPVTPGRVRVIVRHPAYVEAVSESVRLAPSGEATVRLTLLAGGSVEGRVVDERGTPVAGARIDLAATRGSLERTSFSATDGTFAFASLAPEVVLSLSRPESLDHVALRTTMTANEGERKSVELVLPARRDAVTVHVQDERGDPLDAVEVRLRSLAPDAPAQRTLFTNATGEVVFDDVRGLPVRITASLRGRAPLAQTSSAVPEQVRITLPAGIDVTGSVTSRSGRDAVEGAEISLKGASGEWKARSDREGNYRLSDVAPGEARLSVLRDGFAPAERAQRIESPSREGRPVELPALDLTPGGSASGEVVDERGDPVVGARVARGIAPTVLPAGRLPRGVVVTNRRGEFTLGDLPEGEITIEAYAPESGRGRTSLGIVAGRSSDRARIVLTPTAPGNNRALATGGVAASFNDGESGQPPQVTAVVARSEADRAGLAVGDRIVTVDGHAVATSQEARDRLAGPVADDVIVEVARGRERVRLRIARERVSP